MPVVGMAESDGNVYDGDREGSGAKTKYKKGSGRAGEKEKVSG